MKRIISAFVVIAAVLALSPGCEKDERNYALDVYVTAQDSILAQNALVHIYAPVDNSFVDYYLYTNDNGKVSIELDNKAVVEIIATKQPYKGCAFAELDRGVTRVDLDMKLFSDENNGCRENQ